MERFATLEAPDGFYDRRAARVAGLIASLAPRASILDVGCGSGLLAARLATTGARVTALDLSLEQVERAKVRCQGTGVEFRVGGLEALRAEESFDVVSAVGVLPYAADQQGFVAELAGRVHGAGLVVISRTRALTPFVAMELLRHLRRWKPGHRWREIALNLARTGIWSGGFVEPGPRMGARELDAALERAGFGRVAEFGMFNVRALDRATGSGKVGAWFGARYGWSAVTAHRRR